MVEWSFHLLSEKERMLFRRLCMFVGGFTLEAAEEIGSGDGIAREDVLELLSRLIAKSLIQTIPGHTGKRYRILVTLRDYGKERLMESGEEEVIAGNFLYWCSGFSSLAYDGLWGPDAVNAILLVEQEYDNVLIALSISQTSPDRAPLALQIISNLGLFFQTKGYLREGRAWTEAALSRCDSGTNPIARVRALVTLKIIMLIQGESSRVMQIAEEALACAEHAKLTEERAMALMQLGHCLLLEKHWDKAKEFLQEAETWARQYSPDNFLPLALIYRGDYARETGDSAQAQLFYEESLRIFKKRNSPIFSMLAQFALGRLVRSMGDLKRAGDLYRTALKTAWECHHFINIIRILELLADLYDATGKSNIAAQLMGAAQSLREVSGYMMTNPFVDRVKASVDKAELRNEWQKGKDRDIADLITFALRDPETTRQKRVDGMSEREAEVVRLVCDGLTNGEIAENLVISRRTVDAHLSRIFAKAGVSSRAGLVSWAIRTEMGSVAQAKSTELRD
jgi:DNA-binding CsgD family transcriptional regulator/tetratricopeptide (TPR) repeat protein